MQYDAFIGEVQNRARLPSRGDAERAAEATLATLAERLAGDEGEHMLAQLPEELARRIRVQLHTQGESFSFDEFKERVAEREGSEEGDAVYHARAVIEVWREAVPQGQVDHVLSQLTEDYRPLFESGSQGKMRD